MASNGEVLPAVLRSRRDALVNNFGLSPNVVGHIQNEVIETGSLLVNDVYL